MEWDKEFLFLSKDLEKSKILDKLEALKKFKINKNSRKSSGRILNHSRLETSCCFVCSLTYESLRL